MHDKHPLPPLYDNFSSVLRCLAVCNKRCASWYCLSRTLNPPHIFSLQNETLTEHCSFIFFIDCNLFWLLLTCRTSSIFTICASISPRKSDKSSRKNSSSSPHCSIASVQSITWVNSLAVMMKMMACLLRR